MESRGTKCPCSGDCRRHITIACETVLRSTINNSLRSRLTATKKAISSAMEPPEPRTPDQQRDAAADLAVRVRRIELEPAGPSSGPSTPADTQGHRSHLPTWPTTPLTPPEGPGNPADDSRSGLPGGGTSSAPSRNAVKRLRSFGTDTTQPALSGDSRIPTSEPQNPTESPTLLAGISSMPGGAATDSSAVEMPLPSPASQPAGGMRQYLCYFLHRFLDYRAPELHSLAAMDDIPLQLEVPRSEPDVSPFYYCHLPSDGAARQIAERSMLVKVGTEFYAAPSAFCKIPSRFSRCAAPSSESFITSSWC